MKLATVALCLGCLVGCERAHHVSSGPLGAEDLALLHDVPGGNVALVGGNYLRMQEFMTSALGNFAERAVGSATGDIAAFHTWATCFLDAGPMRIDGGVALMPSIDIRFAMRGLTIDKVAACATKAGYPNTVDADHKFIALTLPAGPGGKTMQTGYLQLPDGALYMDMRIVPGRPPIIASTTRADLEAATAHLAGASAGDDKALIDLAAKTDRAQTMWLAMSSTGTPLAEKFRDAYGSIALDTQAMHVDATIRFADATVATKFEDGIAQVKKLVGQFKPEMKAVFDGITVARTDETVHVVAAMTSEQLQNLTKMSGR